MYATQAQIELAAGGAELFRSLADWDGDGVADANVIAQAQESADGWIDGYLRLRFETPVLNPSTDIQRLAADEAVYWMKSKRRMLSEDDRTDRTEREREMGEYRDGKRRPDEPNPVKSTAVKSAYVANCSDMSRENLKGSW